MLTALFTFPTRRYTYTEVLTTCSLEPFGGESTILTRIVRMWEEVLSDEGIP